MEIVKKRTQLLIASLVAAVACVGMGSSLVHAEDGGTVAGGYKIGVVDQSKVFEKYQKQIDQFAHLEKERKDKEDELQAKINDLDQKLEDYKKKKDTMTEDQRDAFETDYKSKMRDVKAQKDKYQSEINDKSVKVIRDLREDIRSQIQKIGAKENYHLILDADSDPRANSSVIYFSTTIDLTQRVIDDLNAEYKQEHAGAQSKSKK